MSQLLYSQWLYLMSQLLYIVPNEPVVVQRGGLKKEQSTFNSFQARL